MDVFEDSNGFAGSTLPSLTFLLAIANIESRMATEINDREVNVGTLSVEQLNGLKTQHENEIRELQTQLETLHGAKNRFIGAKSTLADIKNSPEGTQILIPLNGEFI